jgi:hypothetical protein
MRAGSNCSTSQFGVSADGMLATQDVIQSPFNMHQQEEQPADDEEMIEEEICQSATDSPLINAKTKQLHGKARVLIPSQQPPQFRSTESNRFQLDTMTGFQ